MFNTQILAGSSGQGGETQQSLKFNDDESQYLSWTPAAAGNRKTWTWSGWVKRGNLGIDTRILGTTYTSTSEFYIRFKSNDTLEYASYEGGGASNNFALITTQVFRDPSAWLHLTFVWDTSEATASNRVKFYINGEQVTSFTTANYPTLNYDGIWNNTTHTHHIGVGQSAQYFDGYLSDVYFIDGQALDASSFGQFTDGYWKKKDYSGTYGTNGFHLTFQDDVVSEGFNAATWKGNSPLSQSISGLGFSPDLVWIKSRSQTYNHVLADTVRGQGKDLYSNTTGAESSSSTELISFDADGFSVGAGGSANDPTGSLGFVAWAWDAGSGSPVSNTDGSITSTVKANPSYGFSIVSYTGTGANATVGHGLSSAPDLVIVKNRSIVSSFLVRTQTLAANQTLLLENTTTPIGTDYWQNTQPDSSVFSVSSNSEANGSGNNLIAYCFNSVANYSSIGSYTGNGSTSGPTVTTGFAPAFVMVKRTDSTGSWFIVDNTRDPRSSPTKDLQPNNTGAETDNSAFYTFTSTGFQLKTTGTAVNASGGTYIYMAFADTREAAFWKDVSGNNNNWTPNNLDYRDSLIDSPANNFAVLNAVDKFGSQAVLKEGNLQFTKSTATGYYNTVTGTVGMPSGKWYWEVYMASSADAVIGVTTDPSLNDAVYGGSTSTSWAYLNYNGQKRTNNSSSAYGATWTTGDIIGVALDMDSGTLEFYKNGVSQGQAFTGITGTALPSLTDAGNTLTSVIANFGQDSTFSGNRPAGGNTDANNIGDFAYAPPSGYLALCTANLPTPTIIDGSEHFNTVLYTGDGVSIGSGGNSITGVGHSPDFVWIKARSQAYSSHLYDTVRGATEGLVSNGTLAESTRSEGLTSFDADGFTVGSQLGENELNTTFASWNWKAGGTAVSNTDGSITSQVSANVDAGFSIVSYTGTGSAATVGHGLGVVPSIVIWKKRNGTTNWSTQSTLWADQKELVLNSTSALSGTDSRLSTQSSWTSTTLDLGTYGDQNGSGGTYIAYCFANTDTIKAGSYTGNGSTDGPFAYTGFRPAWIMFKGATIASHWSMFDATRHPSNVNDSRLYANLSNAEDNPSAYKVDLLSNGFKLRHTGSDFNTSGQTYIYLAFAETPLKFSPAR